MKKIVLVIAVLLMLSVSAFALDPLDRPSTNTYSATTTGVIAPTTGQVYIGYSDRGTCNFSGTWTGTIDVEGSIDCTNYDDLYNDITANGNYSFVNMPFKCIRINAEALSVQPATISCTARGLN